MVHPVMFDENDPQLARVRQIALALPQAQERISHGRPNFHTARTFVSYGGVVKGVADRDRYARSILIKPDPDERDVLLQDDRGFLPAYVGPSGWVGYDLSGEPDWGLVAELIDMSYRNTAPARLVRELDGS